MYFNNSASVENLAWASAQIQCYCATDKSPTLNSVSNNTVVINSGTSLETLHSNNDSIIVSTKPKILFCDLTLAPGESIKCKFCSLHDQWLFYMHNLWWYHS